MKIIADEDKELIDVLAQMSKESSRNTLRSWLKAERVRVDERIVKMASSPVKKGQTVSVGERKKIIAGGLHILYEDRHIVVIDKPEGVLSVATNFQTDETAHAFLKDHFRPGKVHVVHRLDQDTSGVMLFALSDEARDELKAAFEKHAMERSYTAVVDGLLDPSSGTWQSYLYEDANYVVHSTEDQKKGRLAITHYTVMRASRSRCLLGLKLETGRKNQIRVHCQDAGCSIVGDKKYGGSIGPTKRLCLHANVLGFAHPITQRPMRFESPIPEAFLQMLSP